MILARTDKIFIVAPDRTVIRSSAIDAVWTDDEGNELPADEQERFEAEYQRDHTD